MSYYRGIKQVILAPGGSGDATIATAYGANGRIIERKTGGFDGLIFFFEENLSDLKEITVTNQKGDLNPYYIMLVDHVAK